MKKISKLAVMAVVLPLAAACASDGTTDGSTTEASTGETSSSGAGAGGTSGGTTSGGSTSGGGGSGGLGIPSLVSVNLQNVLNDLAIRLNIDRANIPVNAQIPISVAANVCGVSINILSVSTGGQAQCTAKTASNELAQSVQQQIAAGGNVGGGAQGGSTVSTGSTTTGGSASGSTTTQQPTSTTSTQPTPIQPGAVNPR